MFPNFAKYFSFIHLVKMDHLPSMLQDWILNAKLPCCKWDFHLNLNIVLSWNIPKSKVSSDSSSEKSRSNPPNSKGLSAIPESDEVSLELGDVMLAIISLLSGDEGPTFSSDVTMS